MIRIKALRTRNLSLRGRIEIDAAMATMAEKMSIRYVFDDTLQDRGAGVVLTSWQLVTSAS
jgi:hypothetical protein